MIGSDQGLLPNVAKLHTGFYTKITLCDNEQNVEVLQGSDMQALLMSPRERSYDLTEELIMTNTVPDSPFQGFDLAQDQDLYKLANPRMTGQVMKFFVTES